VETNPNPTAPLQASFLLSLCLALAAGGSPAAPKAFEVRAVSPRAGLLFTDSEKPDVAVKVTGGGAAAMVAYTVAESAGPWRARGQVELAKLADGAGQTPLPLKLPGRGLYRLDLAARSGGRQARAETWIAVVFTPPRPDPNSPWGIFYTPHTWFNKSNADGPRDAAVSHRLLGASWSRLNFWAHSFQDVKVAGAQGGRKPRVTFHTTLWKRFAKALRAEGISVLGEIAQCPRALSSRPNETATVGDAGPIWCRVKPRDYELWEQLIEQLARDFRREIQVWEVWNEPNLRNRYWTGTVEDFAVHVERTARAFRRGNPKARIAASGFVGDIGFADRLFRLGMGKHIDILSVHYTDERPGQIDQWQRLLARHGLKLPIWNSEERSEVPLRNLASPIERSFKFIHVRIGYPEYRPLVRKDLTVLPAGIAFSVGAHCLGAAKCIARSDAVPGYDVLFFRRGREVIGAFDPNAKTGAPKLFGPAAAGVRLSAEPLDGRKATVTDIWGRSRPLAIKDGRASLKLGGGMLFVNGCRKLEPAGLDAQPADAGAHVFEAEAGRWSKGWSASSKAGFSGGRILEIWRKDDPPPGGYWAEVKVRVPRDGTHTVLFSGNSLARLKIPPSISPFTWQIDDGKLHVMDGPTLVHRGVAGAPEGLSTLGAVRLTKGEHTFRLTLTGRRKQHDTNYALWFDAIVLRRK